MKGEGRSESEQCEPSSYLVFTIPEETANK